MLINDISIIIPAYNEEQRLNTLSNSIKGYNNIYDDIEFIVVCDGTDNTANYLRNKFIQNENIKILRYYDRLGKGGAIKEGFKHCTKDIIFFMDADFPIDIESFETLVTQVKTDGVACCIGNRRSNNSVIQVEQNLTRRWLSKVFNVLFVKGLFGLNLNDTQCGAKAFKHHVLDGNLHLIESNGFEFDVELLWTLHNHGYSITEVPVNWMHTNDSTFKLIYIPSMFLSLMKVRFT